MRIALLALVACSSSPKGPAADDKLAARYPMAKLDDRALCDQLLARGEGHHVNIDPEPMLRTKVLVSDLHLGPGTSDPTFAGIEDFYAEADFRAFLDRHAATGPIDLIIGGDFIEYWQIAAAMKVLPKNDGKSPPLAADQDFSLKATQLVIAAHRDVFRALGELIARGDHRVIIVAGNHDADLLWPKVQLEIARAIAPRDPARLMFVDAASYEHGGVHVEHGHTFDAANKFATRHAPFGRDAAGKCRLQSSWGEVFVDAFYTETERQIPFIDNLYPESAAILWAVKENPDPKRDVGAALRFIDLIRVAETKEFNRDAVGAVLQGVFGTPGGDGGPSARDVMGQLADRLANNDPKGTSMANGLMRLLYDPDLASLWTTVVNAVRQLPDLRAAIGELRHVDTAALGRLRATMFGESMETAAKRILTTNPALSVVVFGHTHTVGGALAPIKLRDSTGWYANTGSWLSVASVKDLRAKGIRWDQLSVVDRSQFPQRSTAIVVRYENGEPMKPILENAR
jgi:UDP-2,3-diacylglucosamine pyrophosphatase LpxH